MLIAYEIDICTDNNPSLLDQRIQHVEKKIYAFYIKGHNKSISSRRHKIVKSDGIQILC